MNVILVGTAERRRASAIELASDPGSTGGAPRLVRTLIQFIPERDTLDDLNDQCLCFVVVAGQFVADFIDHTGILIRQSSRQRIAEHLGGQMADELILAEHQQLLQLCGAFESLAVRQLSFRIDRHTVNCRPPATQHIEVLQPRIQAGPLSHDTMRMWRQHGAWPDARAAR